MRKVLTSLILLALVAYAPPEITTADASQTKPTVAPASSAAVPAGSYSLDKAHASLVFRVNHLGFSNYTARFKRFDAKLEFDPRDLAASTVVATVDANSLETDFPDPAKLDFNAVLKGAEWLDVAKFPTIRFESTQIVVTDENAMRINGVLTLHGVTHPMMLEGNFNGGYAGHPLDPNARIGFSAHGTLKRSEFGVAYGVPAPGTTMGVADDVSIVIEAEFTGPPLAETKTS